MLAVGVFECVRRHCGHRSVVEQVRMYYGSGTVERIASGQPLYAAAGVRSGYSVDVACALTRWQHFSA